MTASNTDQTAVVARWLHEMFGSADGWVTIFADDRANRRKVTEWGTVDQLDALAATAVSLADHGCVWFGCATRHRRLDGNRRGGAEECSQIPALWVDIDIAGPHHRTDKPMPTSVEDALAVLARFPLAPTHIIHTGGGLHGWWMLDEPAKVADVPLDAWGHTWMGIARELGGWEIDNVYDAARVMRLPATWNRKGDEAVSVRRIGGRAGARYGLGDIAELLTEPPAPTRTSVDNVRTIHGDRPGDLFNSSPDGDCARILERQGWTLHHADRNGDTHWTRPGKDTRDGASATVYAEDGHCTIWSSSVPGVETMRPYDPFGLWTVLEHDGSWQAATRAALDLGHGISAEKVLEEWLDSLPRDVARPATIEPEHADAIAEMAAAQGVGLARFRIDWGEFWRADHTAEDFLLRPLLARGRGHAIYAGAKTGKSLLTLEGCAAIATGRPFLDHPGGEPVSVVYMDYEMTPADLWERLDSFGYGPGDDLERLHYVSLPTIPGLDTPEGGAVVMHFAREVDAQLVIIDTTGRAVAGEENSADTFRAFYRHTGQRLKAEGITWARVDHAGKDTDRGQRGSSAKNDDVDIVWRVEVTPEGIRARATHRRVGWVPEVVDMTRRTGDVPLHRLRGDTWPAGTESCARDLDDLGAPQDVSSRDAAILLRANGVGRKDAVIRAAIRWRTSPERRVEEWIEGLDG